MEKLKKVVVKEELVALTGDFRCAIILNQLIYWSERVNDFDKFIEEENERIKKFTEDEEIEKVNGWIYKTTEELMEECMLITRKKVRKKDEYKSEYIKNATVSEYIDYLVEKGWIDKRNNPKYKWDRTYQYRVNILKIYMDLLESGYVLGGYKLPKDIGIIQFQKMKKEDSKIENAISKNENQSSKIEIQTTEKRNAIPETTTEITTEVFSSSKELIEIKKFFDENIHPMTPYEYEKLMAYIEEDKFNYKLIIRAIEIAVTNNKRHLGYIEGILKKWREANILTLEALEAYIRDYEDKKNKKGAAKNGYRDNVKKESGNSFEGYKPATGKINDELAGLEGEELEKWMDENGIY